MPDDVLVGQLGERLALANEALGQLLVVAPRALGRESLDGYRPPEQGVGGEVDLAHAAFAQRTPELVGPELLRDTRFLGRTRFLDAHEV